MLTRGCSFVALTASVCLMRLVPMMLAIFLSLGTAAFGADRVTRFSGIDGPYEVGFKNVFVRDFDRTLDEPGGLDRGVRIIVATMYYPVDRDDIDNASEVARYADFTFGSCVELDGVFVPVEDDSFDMWEEISLGEDSNSPATMLNAAALREDIKEGKTDEEIDAIIKAAHKEAYCRAIAYKNVPVSSDGPFPVIVNTPGNEGPRATKGPLFWGLARNGYISIDLEEPGGSTHTQIGKDPEFCTLNAALDPGFCDGDPATDNDLLANYRDPAVPPAERIDIREAGVYRPTIDLVATVLPPIPPTLDNVELNDPLWGERVLDIEVALETLRAMNEDPDGPFYWSMNTDDVGVSGGSAGGAAALLALALIPEVDAAHSNFFTSLGDLRLLHTELGGIPKDPSETIFFPSVGEPAHLVTEKPVLYTYARLDTTVHRFWGFFRAFYALAGASAQAIADAFGAPADASQENPHVKTTEQFLAAQGPAIYTLLDVDHNDLGYTGWFIWPELRSPTRTNPWTESEYQLALTSKTIHEIIDNKVLAFFDLYLKGECGAIGPLISQRSKHLGLDLRHRNVVPSDVCGRRDFRRRKPRNLSEETPSVALKPRILSSSEWVVGRRGFPIAFTVGRPHPPNDSVTQHVFWK